MAGNLEHPKLKVDLVEWQFMPYYGSGCIYRLVHPQPDRFSVFTESRTPEPYWHNGGFRLRLESQNPIVPPLVKDAWYSLDFPGRSGECLYLAKVINVGVVFSRNVCLPNVLQEHYRSRYPIIRDRGDVLLFRCLLEMRTDKIPS